MPISLRGLDLGMVNQASKNRRRWLRFTIWSRGVELRQPQILPSPDQPRKSSPNPCSANSGPGSLRTGVVACRVGVRHADGDVLRPETELLGGDLGDAHAHRAGAVIR